MQRGAAQYRIALSHFWKVSDAASSNKDLKSGVDRYRSPARTPGTLACACRLHTTRVPQV